MSKPAATRWPASRRAGKFHRVGHSMWKRDQEAQTDVTLCHDMKVDWNCEPMIKEWSFTGHWTYDIEKEKFIAPSLAWCAPVPPEDVGEDEGPLREANVSLREAPFPAWCTGVSPEDVGEDGRPLHEAWATPGEGWSTFEDLANPKAECGDEDDEDIALTVGEAAARFKQNMTPDAE